MSIGRGRKAGGWGKSLRCGIRWRGRLWMRCSCSGWIPFLSRGRRIPRIGVIRGESGCWLRKMEVRGTGRCRIVRSFFLPFFPFLFSSFIITTLNLPSPPLNPFAIPSISALSQAPLPPSISKNPHHGGPQNTTSTPSSPSTSSPTLQIPNPLSAYVSRVCPPPNSLSRLRISLAAGK